MLGELKGLEKFLNDKDNPSKLTGNQTYLTASELRQHLRKLWTNDKELLRHLFKALSLNATDWSTDMDNLRGKIKIIY
jgi:hypothetical protein